MGSKRILNSDVGYPLLLSSTVGTDSNNNSWAPRFYDSGHAVAALIYSLTWEDTGGNECAKPMKSRTRPTEGCEAKSTTNTGETSVHYRYHPVHGIYRVFTTLPCGWYCQYFVMILYVYALGKTIAQMQPIY